MAKWKLLELLERSDHCFLIINYAGGEAGEACTHLQNYHFTAVKQRRMNLRENEKFILSCLFIFGLRTQIIKYRCNMVKRLPDVKNILKIQQ